MAFQSVPQTAEIIVRWLLPSGVIGTNTFYARRATPYNQAAITALAVEVDEWVGTSWLPMLDTGMAYLGTEVRGLELENDLFASDDTNAGAGTFNGTDITNEVTFAIKRTSNVTGRSARGRIFWPLMNAERLQADRNRVSATFIEDILELLNALRVLLEAIGWIEVIVSRWSGGVLRAEGVTFDVAAYAVTDNILDSQRGRRPTA